MSLKNQITGLRRDVSDLQKYTYRRAPGTPAPKSYRGKNKDANAAADADMMEEQMRDLNGRFEEYNYKLNQMSDKLDKAISDFDMRLNSMEHHVKNISAVQAAPELEKVPEEKAALPSK
jgi:TolA-binding protein